MIDEIEKNYDLCIAQGFLKEKEPDIEKAKSMKIVAEQTLEFIKIASKNIPKNSPHWTFVFRDYYETLRTLIETIMLLDGVISENHQCKNAYICLKHQELELSFEFLEEIRTKRNAINYKGKLLKYEEWTMLKINFELHINSCLKKLNLCI